MSAPVQWPPWMYPAAPLRRRIRIAPGADLTADPDTYAWMDISADVAWELDVSEKCGAADEQNDTNSELSFAIDNISGRYTSDDPRSELWPYFDLGCPVEYAVDVGRGYVIVTRQQIADLEDDWPDGTPYRCVVRVQCGGDFRRMGQDFVLDQALRQQTAAAGPAHYWPLTDAKGALTMAPLIGSEVVQVIGAPELQAVTGLPGAAGAYPKVLGDNAVYLGELRAELPGARSAAQWSIEIWVKPESAPTPAVDGPFALVGYWFTDGDVMNWELQIFSNNDGDTLGGVNVIADAPFPVPVSFAQKLDQPLFDGGWHRILVTCTQTGPNFAYTLQVDDTFAVSDDGSNGTGRTMGRLVRGGWGLVNVPPFNVVSNFNMTTAFGHWAIYDGTPDVDTYPAGVAYPGEMAHERIERIAADRGLPTIITATESETLGRQPQDSPLNILRDSEATDHGILTDHRGAVEYLALSELVNQSPSLVIDGNNRELFLPYAPKRNDAGRRNRVRVQRTNGGEYTAEDTANQLRHGVYDADFEVNCATDDRLSDHGQYFLTLGTQEGKRITTLTVRAQSAPQLASLLLTVAPGDIVRVDNPPRQARPGSRLFMVRGRSSRIAGDAMVWEVTYNVINGDPFYVAVIDVDRIEGDQLSTAAIVEQAAPGTVQSISVASSGVLATTDPADFPVDVEVGAVPGGERMRVTAVSGASSPQTFTVIRGYGDGVTRRHATGTPVRLAPVVPLIGM